MKCIFCGGETIAKKTSFVYEGDDEYLVIENVPAEICMKCGEKTYSPEVTDELLGFSKKRFEPVKTIEVPVFDYAERSFS